MSAGRLKKSAFCGRSRDEAARCTRVRLKLDRKGRSSCWQILPQFLEPLWDQDRGSSSQAPNSISARSVVASSVAHRVRTFYWPMHGIDVQQLCVDLEYSRENFFSHCLASRRPKDSGSSLLSTDKSHATSTQRSRSAVSEWIHKSLACRPHEAPISYLYIWYQQRMCGWISSLRTVQCKQETTKYLGVCLA